MAATADSFGVPWAGTTISALSDIGGDHMVPTNPGPNPRNEKGNPLTAESYRLSGPNKLVQWTRVLDVRSPFAIWRPLLPMDEYQRQMQELCELIMNKTGCPCMI